MILPWNLFALTEIVLPFSFMAGIYDMAAPLFSEKLIHIKMVKITIYL